MDNWLKIGSALLLGLMLVLLFPRAKAMLEQSPAAQKGDWQAAVLPVLAVVAFVLLLMALV